MMKYESTMVKVMQSAEAHHLVINYPSDGACLSAVTGTERLMQ